MLELYLYDAGKGDCLRIRFQGASGCYHNIVVDTGTTRFGREFQAMCDAIDTAGESMDLLFLTHVDEDHLGGLLDMVKQNEPLKAGMVVMNHPHGRSEVDPDADVLLSLKQNDVIFQKLSAWGVTTRAALRDERISIDGAQLHILHPTPQKLERLFECIDSGGPDVLFGTKDDRFVLLEKLMEEKLPPPDGSRNNAASIVFVFEYAGKRLLFTGDAGAADILDGIRLYAKSISENVPVSFGAVKLPHHGSAGNISEEWPDVLSAKRFILCANGKSHPDKLTIAKLLKWYGPIEIVSANAWWMNEYFLESDVTQFITPKKLELRQTKEERII